MGSPTGVQDIFTTEKWIRKRSKPCLKHATSKEDQRKCGMFANADSIMDASYLAVHCLVSRSVTSLQ